MKEYLHTLIADTFGGKMEIEKIKYPSLNPIVRQRPNPEILLGHEIFWEEKRDGSNIGAYLDENDEVQLRSRKMVRASPDLYLTFEDTGEKEKIQEFLLTQRDEWNNECVLFGELLQKGKSPTRTEFHEENEFIVFDLYSCKHESFIPYINLYQLCYQYSLKIVELYGTSQHTTIDSLYKFRDEMLTVAKEHGREGVVGKTFHKNKSHIYFKEKLDLPKIEKKPRHIEDGKIVLPDLPESEILGALDKVIVDLGYEKFKDVEVAMPLFAKYVKDECKHHNCKCNSKLYNYYRIKLEEIK